MLSLHIRVVLLFFIALATLISPGIIADSTIKLEDTCIRPQPIDITEVDHSSDVNISLNRCCQDNKFYTPYFDRCSPRNLENDLLERYLDNDDLIVYSVQSNQIIDASQKIKWTSESISDCTDGYFGNSTTEFKLFDDGSLRIGEKRLEPKSFCINSIYSRDQTSLMLVARFCDPDPCSVSGRNCIRKCCPLGMAINEELRVCDPFPYPFNTSKIRGEDSSPINLESFTVYGGLGVKCLKVSDHISFSENPNSIVILPDGRMKNLNYPCKALEYDNRTTKNYCVDNMFHSENETVFTGMRCDPRPTRPSSNKTDPKDDHPGLNSFPYIMLFSAAFIIATLLIYAILPKLRNKFGVIIMCYLVSMAIFFLGLATIQLFGADLHDGVCATLPVLVHYGNLATFTWLNVVCFDLWRTFRVELRSKTRQSQQNVRVRLGPSFIIYSIYGWGLPLVVVVVGQILEQVEYSWPKCALITPGFNEEKCWFHYRSSFIAYIYIPIGIMILFNIILFVWTGFKFCTVSLKTKQVTGNTRGFQRFRVIFSLFLLMGVSWATEVISFMIEGTFEQWVVIDSLNLLTGFFVFVIFICKQTVWQMLKSKLACVMPFSFSYQRSFSSNTTSSNHPTPLVVGIKLSQLTNRKNSSKYVETAV